MTSEINVIVCRHLCYFDNEPFLGNDRKECFVVMFQKITDEIIPLKVSLTQKVWRTLIYSNLCIFWKVTILENVFILLSCTCRFEGMQKSCFHTGDRTRAANVKGWNPNH